MELHINEILEATGGRLLFGNRQGLITDVSIDSRKSAEGGLFVPLRGTHADGHAFIEEALKNDAHAALVQKANPVAAKLQQTCPDKNLIEVDDPLRALGDIAGFWRRKFTPHVVAITGSNGKTTTKEMVWNIIQRKLPAIKNPGNFNNLIGLPLSLLQLNAGHKAAVLEIGMSEPGEIRRLAEICRPRTGLITNIGPSHLEQLETLEDVTAAKAELFESLKSHDIAVVNNDDPRVAALAKHTPASILSFGTTRGDIRGLNMRNCNCFGTALDLHVMGEQIEVEIRLLGRQMISNALAAASIAYTLGIGIEDIKEGLESFRGVPGRMETLDLAGVRIINDSYNANPVSMQASLAALSSMTSGNRKIAVLGDMLELGKQSRKFHVELGERVARSNVDYLYLFGDFSACVREGAVSAGMHSRNIILCDDLGTLTDKLKKRMDDGDSILLKGSRKLRMERVIELLQEN